MTTTEQYLEQALITDSCILHGQTYFDDCEVCQEIIDILITASDSLREEFQTSPYIYYEDAYIIIQ